MKRRRLVLIPLLLTAFVLGGAWLPGPKSLWLIDGADHLETSIVWNDAYRARVRAFLAGSLGRP